MRMKSHLRPGEQSIESLMVVYCVCFLYSVMHVREMEKGSQNSK